MFGINNFQVLTENDAAPSGCKVSRVNEELSVYLKLEGTVDVTAQREKLNAKLRDIQK